MKPNKKAMEEHRARKKDLEEYRARVMLQREEWKRYNLHRTVRNQGFVVLANERILSVVPGTKLTKQAERLSIIFGYQVQFRLF